MENRIIGFILLICAGLVFQQGHDYFLEASLSPSEYLKRAIEKDIAKSLSHHSLQEKSDIHHVTFSYRSKEAFEFLKKHSPQFKTNEKGSIWLEVEILDLPDEKNPGFITQTSIFELKTKNKIGEFGETYYLKELNIEIESRAQKLRMSPNQKINKHQ